MVPNLQGRRDDQRTWDTENQVSRGGYSDRLSGGEMSIGERNLNSWKKKTSV